MVYKWKIPGIYKVDAQVAGDELSRMYQEHGRLDSAQIVEGSRSESSPLHPVFEWDDAVAAEKYRITQAYDLFRAIVTIEEAPDNGPVEVRAFVHAQQSYHPMSVVTVNDGYMDELLEAAKKELVTFKRKYENLTALRPVFQAIDQLAS